MAERRRVSSLLLAVDAGRWWLADSVRMSLRSAVGRLDERWYWFYQWALCHLDGPSAAPPVTEPMDRLIRHENANAEWESLVARLTQDADGDRPSPL